MVDIDARMKRGEPQVVGSFGGTQDLAGRGAANIGDQCDLAEVRLDLLDARTEGDAPWRHLGHFPLLFTARRADEGGAGGLNAAQRRSMLEAVLEEAALIDIEVASITEMAGLIDTLGEIGKPWVASFHDFNGLPEPAVLASALGRARDAGASAFKVAARLNSPSALAQLAAFQLEDHGLPVASMGMGPLAPTSRLLCAQCGSVLNYGFIGATPTAPGQWSARALKEAIAMLSPWPGSGD